MSTPTVVIITFCPAPLLSYGTLLVFKTLRIGFPTARVVVIDNGSHKSVLPDIERAAVDAGCEFRSIRMRHFVDNLRWLLLEQEEFGPFVLLDPDVMLWEKIEDWKFDPYLMAGRLMPWMFTIDKRVCGTRLHPSHLWIPSPDALRGAVSGIMDRDTWSTLIGSCEMNNGISLDTLSPLYIALKDRCHSFTDDELDHFDHLCFGCHLPLMPCPVEDGFYLPAHKQAAAGDISSLRGLWRKQNAFHATREPVAAVDSRGFLSPEMVIANLLDAQGIALTDENMTGSLMLLWQSLGQAQVARAIRKQSNDYTQISDICAAALASHLEQINAGAGA